MDLNLFIFLSPLRFLSIFCCWNFFYGFIVSGKNMNRSRKDSTKSSWNWPIWRAKNKYIRKDNENKKNDNKWIESNHNRNDHSVTPAVWAKVTIFLFISCQRLFVRVCVFQCCIISANLSAQENYEKKKTQPSVFVHVSMFSLFSVFLFSLVASLQFDCSVGSWVISKIGFASVENSQCKNDD